MENEKVKADIKLSILQQHIQQTLENHLKRAHQVRFSS